MSRKILVISNQNNTRRMIESNATTRGELETELNNLGINTTDMSFFEGFSRTDLVDANSQLPARVMYRGRETTDLIITLTPNSIKKVANGVCMTRDEIIDLIHEHDLEDEIIDEFGASYDVIRTDLLERFVNDYLADNDEDCECGCCCTSEPLSKEQIVLNQLKSIKAVVESAIKTLEPTLEDLRNLDLDELAKEFDK